MTDLLAGPGPAAAAVLVAVTGAVEPLVVEALTDDPATEVARRCADITELVAVAEAGHGRVVIVSADLARLDADVVARLRRLGLPVVALVDPDRDSSRRARSLGADAVVTVAAARPGQRPAGLGDVVPAVMAVVQAAPVPADPAAAGYSDPGGSRPTAGPAYRSDARADHRADRAHHRADRAHHRVDDGRGPDPVRTARQDTADALAIHDVEDGEGPGERRRGRVLTVWGAPGAPGRTTVAVTLAAELAGQGAEVLLVDADTHAASVATHLGLLDESAGLVMAVRAALEGRLGTDVLDRAAPIVLPGLRVLTGLTRGARWHEVRPAGFEAVLALGRRVADLVVVDVAAPLERDEEVLVDITAPRRNGATLVAIEQADDLLAVGAGDPVGLQRLVRSLQELQAAGPVVPAAPRVVVTKVRAAAVGRDPGRRIRQALDRFAGVHSPLLVPWDPQSLDAALLAGRTLAEAAPGSPVRPALHRLAAELLGRSVEPGARGVRA